jgi:hypothetical protein
MVPFEQYPFLSVNFWSLGVSFRHDIPFLFLAQSVGLL